MEAIVIFIGFGLGGLMFFLGVLTGKRLHGDSTHNHYKTDNRTFAPSGGGATVNVNGEPRKFQPFGLR